jgi:Tfp pilus assembly protein FimT
MKRNKQSGFSVIELIIYIALVAVFVTASILFAWDVIYGRVKSQAQREVNSDARLLANKISYEIRNAVGVNFIDPTHISLMAAESERDPVEISLSNGKVYFGYGIGGACNVISPCSVNSNAVEVTQLEFEDLSSATTSANISFNLSVQARADRSEWKETAQYQSASEVRSIAQPAVTPTPSISTCDQYCQGTGYAGGSCVANSNQCTNQGGIYEAEGDQYCSGGGGSDTCCCQ